MLYTNLSIHERINIKSWYRTIYAKSVSIIDYAIWETPFDVKLKQRITRPI
jgi:hypothetical protein